ncbi:MAG: tRNA pseudouridine(38-40) synthase TruA [Clostridia bacterium]|nr:tRNA pseudouridine(38-40) synthase TruA [Clostridia bacterium]MBQ9924903.1 tRNA pseudouridine(38-40) synthase TruA [Clostridia bacterium]
MTIALKLSYLGTAYHGWQRQKNGVTIQQKIEEAIEKTCGQKVSVSGCGRTDAGVHAENYVASVRMNCSIPMDRLPHALNARLPDDIVIHEAHIVPDDFDARFSCIRKEYTYRIHNSATRNPFLSDRAYFYPQHLDEKKMQQAARHFVGVHDFSAVRSIGTPVRSPVREIYYLDVERHGDRIELRVCADGFLYNMVRAIAGTLVFVGNGKIDPESIPAILESKDREEGGPTAPACGLYMTALTYGMEAIDVRSKRD